jgi:hypothetical protein
MGIKDIIKIVTVLSIFFHLLALFAYVVYA